MKKMFKQIFVCVMAIAMCISTSAVAFAAETETATPVVSETVVEENGQRAAGNVIGFTSASLPTGSGTFTYTLDSANWWTDFSVSISGNNNGRYRITMSHDGKTYTFNEVYGNGLGASIELNYASAGLYTFTVTNVNGSTAPVTAFVNVYD